MEQANAAFAAAGLLGQGAATQEHAGISGRFDAVLHSAKPQHQREYLQLHAHVQDLRSRAATRQRLLARLGGCLGARAGDLAVHVLLRDANEASAHMRTLMEVQAKRVAPNLVTDVGARFLLDQGLSGSAYTAAFFLGLISSVGFTAVANLDTMSSHVGWGEAGLAIAPAYSETTRRTAAWAAAASRSKPLSAGLVFTFTSAGTVKGPFLTTVNTKDGVTGTLYSAGLFTGGDQPVVNTNTLTVSYTASL